MDKSFDGMHEKYDFDSIQFSVKKTISISMIVTSVHTICRSPALPLLYVVASVEAQGSEYHGTRPFSEALLIDSV